jgi:glycosylphosphatidylinositol transamidase (GPIT) subunit GPI8
MRRLINNLFFNFTLLFSHTLSSPPSSSPFAILIDTSRYWYNYRHAANTFAIYQQLRSLGVPDSNIILMVAEDLQSNPRNPRPGQIWGDLRRKVKLYSGNTDIDYRGDEVTCSRFIFELNIVRSYVNSVFYQNICEFVQ